MNREATGAVSASGFQTAPRGTHALSSGARSRKITSLAGILCNRLRAKPFMKFRHLEYFVAAAEELNFTHAADRLHVSQPPFSKQIHDLEGELGIELFERRRTGG